MIPTNVHILIPRFCEYVSLHAKSKVACCRVRGTECRSECTGPFDGGRHYHLWVSEVAQSCPTLSDSVDCSLPGSSVHGSFQARVMEWVAISLSRWSSQPRDRTRVSCIVGRHFTIWATREALFTSTILWWRTEPTYQQKTGLKIYWAASK